MTQVKFDIKTFDVGGKGAIKGDKRLTGAEIQLARRAGWDIDKEKGYTLDMGTPKRFDKKNPNPDSCDPIGDLLFGIIDYIFGSGACSKEN